MRQYDYNCAMCQSKGGDGKGDVATDMKLKMRGRTDPATLKDRTDGELFYIIKNGRTRCRLKARGKGRRSGTW